MLRLLVVPIVALTCLAAIGCDGDPQQEVTGVWTLDQSRTQFPEAVSQTVDAKLGRNALFGGTVLKVRPDHSFQLVFLNQDVRGTWTFKGDTLMLTPKAGDVAEVKVSPDRKRASFTRPSPVGDITIALQKTG